MQSGAVGFIPYELPIVQETPTLIVGLKVEEHAFSLIASLNKEVNSFFSECLPFNRRDDFLKLYTATMHEALITFVQ